MRRVRYVIAYDLAAQNRRNQDYARTEEMIKSLALQVAGRPETIQYFPVFTETIQATEALTANRFVSHAKGLPSAGGNTFGVALSNAAIGDDVTVVSLGTAPAEASAAIAEGAAVEVLADGRIVTASTGVPVARARQAASAAGQVIEVFLIPN